MNFKSFIKALSLMSLFILGDVKLFKMYYFHQLNIIL